MDIKEWLKREGLKQGFIAKKLGLSDAQMSKIVLKKKPVPKYIADMIVRMSKRAVDYQDMELATWWGEQMSLGRRRKREEREEREKSANQ